MCMDAGRFSMWLGRSRLVREEKQSAWNRAKDQSAEDSDHTELHDISTVVVCSRAIRYVWEQCCPSVLRFSGRALRGSGRDDPRHLRMKRFVLLRASGDRFWWGG